MAKKTQQEEVEAREEKAEKEAKKELHKHLTHVKDKEIDFEGDVQLAVIDPNDKTRVMGSPAQWPGWVDQAMTLLRNALLKIGVDVQKMDVPTPDELLHELIEFTDRAPASWQKFMVISALTWIHGRIHGDDILKAIRGA